MKDITERFLKYVSFHTTSSETSDSFPSTERQFKLGEYLAGELKEIGLTDARLDARGYVYAHLPASEGCALPPLGLISHMDTSPSVSGENIHARILTYTGGDIELSEKEKITLDDYPFLADYMGKELIVTDGSTLLGADDKAGIAEIVGACEYLAEHPEIGHREVCVCFTPDEEVGRGVDFFDKDAFGAHEAYTVDGGELGEIEYENFNAASAVITVNGINIHPGSAKNKMVNASLIAAEFIEFLPPEQTPAHTEGYEGFFHVCSISGDESLAKINIIIRDHDRTLFEKKKEYIKTLTAFINKKYGRETVQADISDSYYNMREKIEPHMHLIDNAKTAMLQAGVTPRVVPIRGGTDGARLSYEGIACPNLSTGGANFHSKHEFVCVEAMQSMTEVLVNLLKY